MPNSKDQSEKPKAKVNVVHSAEMEAEMEDRWDDALLRGIHEGIRRRNEKVRADKDRTKEQS